MAQEPVALSQSVKPKARITQVTALLGLPPAVQEAVLLGEGGIGIREAIRAVREAQWDRQPR